MDEYIKKDRAIELIDEIFDSTEPTGIEQVGVLKCRRAIRKEQPASDVVEVVRCEKCKYYFDERCNHEKNRVIHRVPDFGKHYSYVGRIKVEPDHYCSYGERKEGADNA